MPNTVPGEGGQTEDAAESQGTGQAETGEHEAGQEDDGIRERRLRVVIVFVDVSVIFNSSCFWS